MEMGARTTDECARHCPNYVAREAASAISDAVAAHGFALGTHAYE